MIHHPLILGPKLIVLAILVVLLIVLHGMLPPDQFRVAVILVAVAFIVFSVFLWVFAARLLRNPESRMAKATTHMTRISAEDGYIGASKEFESLLGKKGTTVSALRPSGTALIEDRRIPVVTSGEFVQAGATVVVEEVKGSKVVVREGTSNDE